VNVGIGRLRHYAQRDRFVRELQGLGHGRISMKE